MNRALMIAPILAMAGLAACSTKPAPNSGFLSSYADMQKRGGINEGASIQQRRDDAASDSVDSVFLEKAVFAPRVGEGLTETERSMVLREVDRQICFEVSERFAVVTTPTSKTATVRTAIVRFEATGRVGSVVSAASGFVVPVVTLRVPGSTGGLAVESELLEPGGGRQIAAISWARTAQVVGMDTPSLSRVGDALQMAEPMGDAVREAFATKARKEIKIPSPDPCAAYGPRRDIGRMAASMAVDSVTGLYFPEAAGTGPQKD